MFNDDLAKFVDIDRAATPATPDPNTQSVSPTSLDDDADGLPPIPEAA